MGLTSVLVVGCGSIGERHLRCFQKTGRARVTACDLNPDLRQRLAATYAVPAVADAGAAIRSTRPSARVTFAVPFEMS